MEHLPVTAEAHLPAQSLSWTPTVRSLLADLKSGITDVLGVDLVGLYLYGSLVTGDFDELVSDVDLLAVTCSHLDGDQFRRLDVLHRQVEQRNPAWSGRIETAYVSTSALATFKQVPSPIAVISPGEAFHIKTAGTDWLLNWYTIRTQGTTLLGPPASTLIDEITTAELLGALRAQMEQWREHVHSAAHPGFQAYAILTACRALYTNEHAIIASKNQSATWAKRRLPQWSELIDHALELRALGGQEGEADHGQTARFVNAVADQINQTTESTSRRQGLTAPPPIPHCDNSSLKPDNHR